VRHLLAPEPGRTAATAVGEADLLGLEVGPALAQEVGELGALTDGFDLAFAVAAVFCLAAVVIAVTRLRARRAPPAADASLVLQPVRRWPVGGGAGSARALARRRTPSPSSRL